MDDIAFIPPTLLSNRNSHQYHHHPSGSNSNSRRVLRGPDESDGTQRPILSPRNVSTASNATSSSSTNATPATQFSNSINHQSKGVLQLSITSRSSAPVDLDDSQSESMMESIHSRDGRTEENQNTSENHPSERAPNTSSTYSGTTTRSSAPIFTMPESTNNTNTTTMMLPKLRFSAGNISVGSEETDGESSSFNLSTDAEDTEYEAMRRRLGATGMMNGMLMLNHHGSGGGGGGSVGTSTNMDMSVANYTTDGETSVFPGLPSEDDATQTTASVTKEASQNSILHLPTVNPATGASLVPVGYGNSNNNHPYAGAVGFPGVSAYHNHHSQQPNSNHPLGQDHTSSPSKSQPLKVNDSNSNHHSVKNNSTSNMINGMIQPRDDNTSSNRLTKPKVDDQQSDVDNMMDEDDPYQHHPTIEIPQSSFRNRMGYRNGSTTPTLNDNTSNTTTTTMKSKNTILPVSPLESSKRDSPDSKAHLRASPNTINNSMGAMVDNFNNNSNNNINNGSTNSNGFKQYNSNYTDATFGSELENHTKNSKNTNSTLINTPTASQQPSQATSSNPVPRRGWTSPKKASTVVETTPPTTTSSSTTTMTDFDPFTMDNSTGFTSSTDMDLFADFADFSNFDNAFTDPSNNTGTASTVAVSPTPVTERVGRTAASPFIDRPDEKSRTTRHSSIGSTGATSHNNGGNHHRNSFPTVVGSSAVHNDASLSELLEKAKSKSSRSSGSHAKKTSSSVNSAPAPMTASYLRQHHNLGSKSRSSKSGDGASVTDIIQSLEAANATRLTSGSSSHSLGNGRRTNGGNSSRDDGFSSAHSREGASSVMSAKERIRRRRERRHQRGGDVHSSDSENEHEDNESWLFDEVTGALGPRGIAADLESLSGRSNRSSSSRGNKSHRSHRSHKSGSRSSRHRRPKTTDSAESVDSHHSRDSRRSRSSRYSHRSTRSYISQMSEQSRSVANDLLRLEMQLAMVGSAGVPGADGGSSSVGGIARNTRSLSSRSTPPVTTPSISVPSTTSGTGARRMASARRNRITIQAPAGRLGIILANKADARGTVVSGVRSNSALVDRIMPGDRIVAIDGEDVSLMTVSEITTIMARKADFERTLTVLTTPRHTEPTSSTTSEMNSPRSTSDPFQQRSSYRS
jgi:hypothetical protein